MAKTVPVPIDHIIQTTGYLGRTCILCGACGWTNGPGKFGQFEYPTHSKKMKNGNGEELYMPNFLFHEKKCVMNEHLNDDGSPRN